MKQNKKWIAIVMMLVMMLSLTACSGKKEDSIVGEWKKEYDEHTYTYGMGKDELLERGIEFIYSFSADGKITMTEKSPEYSNLIQEGTYRLDGNLLIIDEDELYPFPFSIDGNRLIIEPEQGPIISFIRLK